MATDVRYAIGLLNGQITSAAKRAGRFFWHFVQMFVAMMIGMMPYHAIFGSKPSGASLILWYAGMELSMIPGMVLLMLFQKHGWRHTAEMTVFMLIGPVVVLFCAQLGWHNYIPGLSLIMLLRLADLTMLLGMLAAMLYRREMYTSPRAVHQHAAHAH